MLSAARVRRSRDKRKSKHPENLFLPMLRQGVLLKTFSSATYCLAVAVTFQEKAWGEFPDAALADGCILGMVRLALASLLRGIVRASLTMTDRCCNF